MLREYYAREYADGRGGRPSSTLQLRTGSVGHGLGVDDADGRGPLTSQFQQQL